MAVLFWCNVFGLFGQCLSKINESSFQGKLATRYSAKPSICLSLHNPSHQTIQHYKVYNGIYYNADIGQPVVDLENYIHKLLGVHKEQQYVTLTIEEVSAGCCFISCIQCYDCCSKML